MEAWLAEAPKVGNGGLIFNRSRIRSTDLHNKETTGMKLLLTKMGSLNNKGLYMEIIILKDSQGV